MPNDNPVKAAKDAYEIAQKAAYAIILNVDTTAEEKDAAEKFLNSILAAYNRSIMKEAEQRTVLLATLICELRALNKRLRSPGIGDAIGKAITTVNMVLESDLKR